MSTKEIKSTKHILVDLNDEGILTITMNRPQKKNAMNVEFTFEMQNLLMAVAASKAVRVVILKGAGDGFCAGMDIKDFFDLSEHDEDSLSSAKEVANHWRVRLEACDIAFCADSTNFALSEINFGHFPAGPVAKSLALAMHSRAASYYSLSGRPFNGKEAESSGFITKSWPDGELEAETIKLAQELVKKDPIALQFTKESLEHVKSMEWDAALSYNSAKFAELKTLQKGASSRATSVANFLDGKFKPGLGS